MTVVPNGGKAVFRALWQRAPMWRVCLIIATALSVVVVLFPPSRLSQTSHAQPAVPEDVAYDPPPKAVAAQSAPMLAGASAPIPAPIPASTPARVVSASAAAVTATARPVATAAAPTPRVATAHVTTPVSAAATDPARPPSNAQISLAPPPGSTPKEPSGLNTAFVGRTYSGFIQSSGFNVPLPPGQWAMLSNSSIHFQKASGMAYFLGRIENRQLVGGVRIFALRSNSDPGDGFPMVKGCVNDNPNYNYVFVESVTPLDHQSCWTISNYYTPPLQQWADKALKIAQLDRAAGGDLAAKGVTYPQDFVAIRFSRAEKWGFLETTYLFSPEAAGITSTTAPSFRDSDWHVTNIGRFPEKLAYLAKQKDWATSFWPKYQQAFDSAK